MRVTGFYRLACWAVFGCLCLVCPRPATAQTTSSGSMPSLSKTLSFSFPLSERQAFFLSTEFVSVTSFPDAFARQIGTRPSWKFKGVPITFGYTHTLTSADRRIVPFVGVGLSYYLSEIRQLEAMGEAAGVYYSVQDFPSAASEYFDTRLGMGYGAQAMLGLRADVNRYTYVSLQARARYVNGLGFTSGRSGDLGSEFTKLDFALGLGFKF